MKTGFKDPAAIKSQKPEDKPKNGKNTPWDYTCPQYDQRTSCFINAGTNYGVAHRQPVGHKDGARERVDVVPFGRVNALKTTVE